MALTRNQQRAKAKREKLLAALDEEDDRLLAALESERDQPYYTPYRYDLTHRLPMPRRP